MNLEQRLESAKSKGYIVAKRLDVKEFFFIKINKYPAIDQGMIIKDAIGCEYVVQTVLDLNEIEVSRLGSAWPNNKEFDDLDEEMKDLWKQYTNS